MEIPATHDVRIEKDLVVCAPDGVPMTTDVYHPVGDGTFPTLLQRTCYGKDLLGPFLVPWFAERGYRVVLQDCRGSGGSGGEPDFFAEATDGRAAGDWIVEQPWFDGRFGAFGASYMGFTQWAFASTKPPYLQAMAVALYGSKRAKAWYPGGGFALDLTLTWAMTRAIGVESLMDPAGSADRLAAGFAHLPLLTADEAVAGRTIPWWRDQVRHASVDDPYWQPLDFSRALPDVGVPVLLLDGWYDYQTPHVIDDFAALGAAGVPRRLVIGPWVHAGVDQERSNVEMFRWFERHLRGVDDGVSPSEVAIFVMPDVGWRDPESWPPPSSPLRLHLRAGGGLDGAEPVASPPSGWTYDPADPTPSFGGISLRPDAAGAVDNRALEARADVLTFTTEPLESPVEVVGPVRAELHVSSDVEHLDVFVRLCDVDPDGGSINVCDGYVRLRQDVGEARPVAVDLWPTAQRFEAGHRVRLLVAGGAHPLYARNLGSGEPLATGTTLVVGHHRVHHDPDHPSAIVLPVVP